MYERRAYDANFSANMVYYQVAAADVVAPMSSVSQKHCAPAPVTYPHSTHTHAQAKNHHRKNASIANEYSPDGIGKKYYRILSEFSAHINSFLGAAPNSDLLLCVPFEHYDSLPSQLVHRLDAVRHRIIECQRIRPPSAGRHAVLMRFDRPCRFRSSFSAFSVVICSCVRVRKLPLGIRAQMWWHVVTTCGNVVRADKNKSARKFHVGVC